MVLKNELYYKMITVISENARRLAASGERYVDLIDDIGAARFVLIGEATHGTREFYQARIDITKELIQKKNFMAVAIEGDWPDTYRIHRYLQGVGEREDWQSALTGFKRFPTWMWRNETIPPFLQWLRDFNESKSRSKKIGFYGMDLYSLNTSMQAVIDYLTKVDPEAAKQARSRYACFDHLKMDPQSYGYLTTIGAKKACVKEAVDQFLDLQHHAMEYVHGDGVKEDEYFSAEQNARLIKNAEHYYRNMFEGHVSSWNIRDQHMAETVNVLADHLEHRFKTPAKIVVWAHNSHMGDARATEMGENGEVNIGQLIREQHNHDAYLIGFSTNHGTVTAANDWDEPAQCRNVNPGIEGSYEDIFHDIPYKNFLLKLRSNKTLEHFLKTPRLQRAIGVIYRPETERASHYFFTRLPYQFDAIIHLDKTTAIKPLDSNE